jgi:hypothetical protein
MFSEPSFSHLFSLFHNLQEDRSKTARLKVPDALLQKTKLADRPDWKASEKVEV